MQITELRDRNSYELNVCVPPSIHMLNLIPNVIVIGAVAFGK